MTGVQKCALPIWIAVSFQAVSFEDEYCFEYGWRQEIRKKYGISVEGIISKAKEIMYNG